MSEEDFSSRSRGKKERSVLRQGFSKLHSTIEAKLQCGNVVDEHVVVSMQLLQEKYTRISELDGIVMNELLSCETTTSQDLDSELERVDSYKAKWLLLHNKFEKLRHEPVLPESMSESLPKIRDSGTAKENPNCTRQFKLPKLGLITFDGNIRNWIAFWGQFKKIHDDNTLDSHDKFQYLVAAIPKGTSARELIDSFPPSGDNYCKAIEHLRERYGREELLIEVYIRDLISLVLSQVKNDYEMSLSSLYDKLTTQLRALESMGLTSEKYAVILRPLVESSLPSDTLQAWERLRASTKMESGMLLDNILKFLKGEVESSQRIFLARAGFSLSATCSPNIAKSDNAVPTTSCLVAGEGNSLNKTIKDKCIWCDKNSHSSIQCFKLANLSLDDRKSHVRNVKACAHCLKIGHSTFKCRAYVKCIACFKRHNVLFCPEVSRIKRTVDKQEKRIPSAIQPNTDLSLSCRNSVTLLQTLIVKILYMDKEYVVRALIDTGAQRSYIKREIAQLLSLPVIDQESLGHVVFGGVETKMQPHKVYNIMITNLDGTYRYTMNVLDEDKICGDLPRVYEDDILKDLKRHNILLTDRGKDISEIGLLIGADYSGMLLTSTVVQLDNGLTAVKTKLGWTIQGVKAITCTNVLSNTLHISQLWDLETLGIKDPSETKSQKKKELELSTAFTESIRRNQEGRYEVNLPWKEGHELLMTNRGLAEKRLIGTTKRLISSDNFQAYNKVFQDWLDRGIIEVVHEDNGKGHYLAHHAVIRNSSTTTRVRPVFDASARDERGNYLNNCLEKGTNLLELIPRLLIQFRMHAVGVTADIEKAFLQISIKDCERDYLKFLWWKDEDRQAIMTYRHCRVVFGLTCSPFLLAATIIFHLSRVPDQLHCTAQRLLKSYYVDNCVISMEEQEVMQFIQEAKQLMSAGKFNLREWVVAPMKECTPEKKITSVLGVLWDTQSDLLYCNINIPSMLTKRLTKRTLLSIAQRIFDPIGYTSPTMVVPKLLLQEAWIDCNGWDAELSPNITRKFYQWLEHIHLLSTCQIPRRLTLGPIKSSKISLHVFSDACQRSYAACVFLRSEHNGCTSVQLVLAKTRVAPCKQKITIPRLELMAALIGTRLCKTVKEAVNIDCPEYYWSDSTVVLTWIKKDAQWAVFVQNRVKEIRESTNLDNWHYIPGPQNPADLPSRGCNAKILLQSKWWECSWLKESKNCIPTGTLNFDLNADVELRKHVVCVEVICKQVELAFIERLAYFSKFSKIVRMFTWILRFINNTSNSIKTSDKELTSLEVEKATKRLWQIVQASMNNSVLPKSKKGLATFRDEDGLIRVHTKLLLIDEPEDFKCPILLPGTNVIVERLVQQRHELLMHADLLTLMCAIREQYWVIGLRHLVKRVISRCGRCRRFKAKPCTVPFAPLPRNRLNKYAAVFETSGIDYAGPLYLRSGEKCYIVIFTCAVYRAIHLELAESMSTNVFIMCLRRFIARRGRVKTIYSDNGSNFVGVNNLLKTVDWSEIQAYSTVHKITWIFNPPTAAWWGGWWERIIRSVKDLLRRMLGRAVVTYAEMETILCDCEAIVNTRPLTYITECDELVPLTPNIFLQSIPSNEIPDLDTINRQSLNERVRYVQKLRDDIRHRFRTEYLAMLVHRGNEGRHSLKVGDVVLVEADSKRVNWPLGIIDELYPGADGHTRVAKIRTQYGERIRPVQRLYPMEVSEDKVDEPLLAPLPETVNGSISPEAKRTRSGRVVKIPQRFY